MCPGLTSPGGSLPPADHLRRGQGARRRHGYPQDEHRRYPKDQVSPSTPTSLCLSCGPPPDASFASAVLCAVNSKGIAIESVHYLGDDFYNLLTI
jgi:hypothetical protein